jgi:hypothetical protein
MTLALTSVLTLALVGATARAHADGDAATLFRIFLTNGSVVTSYGEYARVDDRVVFSIPLTMEPPGPSLHVVSLPESVIDWARTERYAESARYMRYATTRGDADFAALTTHISQVFNDIALTKEPAIALQTALGARRLLAEWPRAHFGYRSTEVAQFGSMLDEVISELRARTGGTAFDLTLIASIAPPPVIELSPAPSPQEAIDQALAVARATDVPAERMSLLGSIARVLGGPEADPWAVAVREAAEREMVVERQIDADYALLTRNLLASATRFARRADVGGVERVLASVERRDRWLGGKRPDQIQALTSAISARLEEAQRLRLALDHWYLRLPALNAYRSIANDLLGYVERARPRLEAIKNLAGPSELDLARLARSVDTALRGLRPLSPPDELQAAHAMTVSAIELAESAVRGRRDAVRSGDFNIARDASAAAAGSLMLLSRAREELALQLKPPQLK